MSSSRTTLWTFVVTSAAAFVVALDNLVVTMALPSIRLHLHASLADLEWTANAYILTFAVLLMTGATLGERYGRRRVFVAGMALFTLSSASAAIAPNVTILVASRAFQGAGAAVVLPLSLTILSAAVPAERRGAALGVWGAMNGLAIAVGPVIGGAVVQGLSWQWIFWLNVPIGVAVVPLAACLLDHSEPTFRKLDVPGVILASMGLLGIVFGLVRGNSHGWTSPEVLGSLILGAVLVGGFLAWEVDAPEPMLPLRLFSNRTFSATNAASFLFQAGLFGAIFLMAQFLQTVQGYSPLQAGVRILPWTIMPLFIAPIAGPLSDRIGGRPLLILGLTLQSVGLAVFALLASPTVAYIRLVPPLVVSGIGMSLFFVPVANTVLGSVRPEEEGVASGANNALRELGGVFGIAVLGAVFSATGSFASPAAFVHGLTAAIWVGTAILVAAVAASIAIPRRIKAVESVSGAALA